MSVTTQKQRTHNRYATTIIVLLALAGVYGLTLAGVLPIPLENLNYAFSSFGIIVVLLVVPYWILKLTIHVAHQSPREKELKLDDLPKHQPQPRKEKRRIK